MALIRVERVAVDKVLEAQEFQTGAPIVQVSDDGTTTLYFQSDEGHPSLTVMLDVTTNEGGSLRDALSA